MKNLLSRIWFEMKRFWFSTFYVWIALAVAVVVYFIWGLQAAVFTGIGIVLAVILFVWGRSIWWFISGTGDYYGRVGLLKSLWIRIFKK